MRSSSNLSAWLSSPRKKKIVSFTGGGGVCHKYLYFRGICYTTVHQNIRKNVSLWFPRLFAKIALACDAQKTHTEGLVRAGQGEEMDQDA